MGALEQRYHAEVGVDYLRRLAVRLGLQPEDTVIFRSTIIGHHDTARETYGEWATIPSVQNKGTACNDIPGSSRVERCNIPARWIYCQDNKGQTRSQKQLRQRQDEINQLGERCGILLDSPTIPRRIMQASTSKSSRYYYQWDEAPHPFSPGSTAARFVVLQQSRVVDNNTGFRLCVRKEKFEACLDAYVEKMSVAVMTFDLEEGIKWLGETANVARAADYVSGFFNPENIKHAWRVSRPAAREGAAGKRKRSSSHDADEDSGDGAFLSKVNLDLSCLFTWTIGSYRTLPVKCLSSFRALEVASVLLRAASQRHYLSENTQF